jgi:hypothetical protein
MSQLPAKMLAYGPEVREQARRAIAKVCEDVIREAGKKYITVEKVKAAGSRSQNGTNTMLGLWRTGEVSVADSWGDPPKPAEPAAAEKSAARSDELLSKIEAAENPRAISEVAREVMRLVARGDLEAGDGRVILDAAREQRNGLEQARELEPPPEDPRKLLLAGASAMDAARALDRFVDLERRDRVLAFIAAEVEADRISHPNEDEGGA